MKTALEYTITEVQRVSIADRRVCVTKMPSQEASMVKVTWLKLRQPVAA